jgi:hypothetical protein
MQIHSNEDWQSRNMRKLSLFFLFFLPLLASSYPLTWAERTKPAPAYFYTQTVLPF